MVEEDGGKRRQKGKKKEIGMVANFAVIWFCIMIYWTAFGLYFCGHCRSQVPLPPFQIKDLNQRSGLETWVRDNILGCSYDQVIAS